MHGSVRIHEINARKEDDVKVHRMSTDLARAARYFSYYHRTRHRYDLPIHSHVCTPLNNSPLHKLRPIRIDDIEDDSMLRRGKPAAHLVFGKSQTINSATYLFAKASRDLDQLQQEACKAAFLGP